MTVVARTPPGSIGGSPGVDEGAALARVGEWERLLEHAPLDRIADDLAALAARDYRGGATGMPKGCQHTRHHMVCTATAIRDAVPGGGDGIVPLRCLPVLTVPGRRPGSAD
ncbi:hypothetical protein [Streptomyces sp900116325]|uniref:hypothetical protein n=1 Tax=Streptomyces sp. 900116325 TaxID=3154295 RepID=UPI0033BA633B